MPDSNDDLLAQLQGISASSSDSSNADVLAALNAEPEPDPLANVEYTDDLEADAAAEITALQQGFRDRASRENDRFRLATDSEYWIAVCFKSREDKEAFLTAAGLMQIGDKYLDGYAVAKRLGVQIEQGEEG